MAEWRNSAVSFSSRVIGWSLDNTDHATELEKLGIVAPTVRSGESAISDAQQGNAGSVEFIGMEVVRRDWTVLAKQVQRELYRRLFTDQAVGLSGRARRASTISGPRQFAVYSLRRGGIPMFTARFLGLACWAVSMAAWSQPTAAPVGTATAAAAAKRDAARCVTSSDVDACNDAIRRNPSDPALLVALGDALVHAKRVADAIRHYRRAEALAPHLPGLAAKLSAAEKRLASERSAAPIQRTEQPASRMPADSLLARAPAHAASGKRYSNADPETQSH